MPIYKFVMSLPLVIPPVVAIFIDVIELEYLIRLIFYLSLAYNT